MISNSDGSWKVSSPYTFFYEIFYFEIEYFPRVFEINIEQIIVNESVHFFFLKQAWTVQVSDCKMNLRFKIKLVTL